MNNTEYSLLTKEKLFEMYEQVCIELEIVDNRLYEKDSEITELESEVDYWRGKYEEARDD